MADRQSAFVEERNGVQLREIVSYGDADMVKKRRAIHVAAGTLRELLVPPGAGAELTLIQTYLEAVEFIARNPEPESYGEFPFVVANATADGTTVREAAAAILTKGEVFRTVGPVIQGMVRESLNTLKTERSAGKVKAAIEAISIENLIARLKERGMTDEQIAALQSG